MPAFSWLTMTESRNASSRLSQSPKLVPFWYRRGPTLAMTFRPEILDELGRHGLRPRPDTSAAQLREQISDLYRFEIRKLRDRCRAGEFPIDDLSKHVMQLRSRYILLSIPIQNWIET